MLKQGFVNLQVSSITRPRKPVRLVVALNTFSGIKLFVGRSSNGHGRDAFFAKTWYVLSRAERHECIVSKITGLDAVICITDSGEIGAGSKSNCNDLAHTGPQALAFGLADRSK